MTNYVWYPVTGDGQTQLSGYVWNGGVFNWNTGSFWAAESNLLLPNPNPITGAVPGSGGGTGVDQSQGPGLDNVAIVSGDIATADFALYVPNPPLGDPYINSNSYPADVLINSGTVDINGLSIASWNAFADVPQTPTIDVEGAVFKIEGTIANTFTATFPQVVVFVFGFPVTIGGTETASSGGTIDIGTGGTVEAAGLVQSSVVFDFKDATGDLLGLGGVSSSQPSEFQGTIAGFGAGDTIDLTGIPFSSANTETYADNSGSGVLTVSDGTTTLATLAMTGSYSTPFFQLISDTSGGTDIVTACFAEGTHIRTHRGEVAVQHLRIGDQVVSAFGGAPPIKWLGHRLVDCMRHPHPHDVMPVRVMRNAFGPGLPARDLLLSPDHAVYADSRLVPVRYLVNGASIAQEKVRKVTYWHVELPAHDVLFAEGLPAETYLDTGNRQAFVESEGAIQMTPEFARDIWAAEGCAPLVIDRGELGALNTTLLQHALALGFDLTPDPALSVESDGSALPLRRRHGAVSVALPGNARRAVLRSRRHVPEQIGTAADNRSLGVAVASLALDGRMLALDDPRLGAGWHAAESDLRWTAGAAELDVTGAGRLDIILAEAGAAYWVPPRVRLDLVRHAQRHGPASRFELQGVHPSAGGNRRRMCSMTAIPGTAQAIAST
jgi:hypothetical protein